MSPKVVVITGASAGVGRATAWEFAKRGDAIALLARDPARLEAARRDVEQMGGRAIAIPTDVADPDQVERAAERAEAELGPIDVWINNAMATIFAPFLEITPEEFVRATAVTYFGTVYGTLSALRRMRTRDHGVIVQVGSAVSYRAIPLQSPYCGAKFAVRGFTDALRSELIHDGSNVRLTTVQLPALNTMQFSWGRTRLPFHPQPIPPIFQPELAAQAIARAADRPRREYIVGWPSLKAIVSTAIAPDLGDRMLARIGYEQQHTGEPIDPNRPSNLFQPVPGPFGAHGRFDHRARATSIQWWLSMHRISVILVLCGLLLGVLTAWTFLQGS